MSKTFIFFRGPKTERRSVLVSALRNSLSGAVWISLDQVDLDVKRAHARCMSLTKEALLGSESVICVDNESMLPIHWQAYQAISERNHIDSFVVGIDVLDSSDPAKLNLQMQNCALFIASVDKYWCVKTDIDANEVSEWISNMMKG